MKSSLINFVTFQMGWFACVLSAAANQPWIGVCIAIVIMTVHIAGAISPANEFKLILIAMVLGTIWDSLLVSLHLLDYKSGSFLRNVAPYWIIILWGLFATTLNMSLDWLKQRLLLAIVFGAIAGPLAYYAGQQLGAVTFTNDVMAFTALATGWALFTPVLLVLARRFNGYKLTRTGII